ncbi:hypothetical protein GCM10009127_26410 [Alteraurantiacibacter aestuarii]|uniref:Glycosyltransferase n=1 Tax=Alteraurantiacibacter aestuarii TaxID=650004 RepID=A0A844ZN63_9SPHN|nr:glycosyltransferase family 2 protein [Alteraurantiacibacter aestuarii]MXO88752.1 glycosyltransferase [Alteraurantiacibacter aestuarii]
MNRNAQTRPHFSVIVPVYNAQDTIEATIASIREQDDEDFELILIDDGSTDDSLLRMLRQAGRDPRIRLVAQQNAGVSAARNHGLQLASGRLMAFCDADDLWHPAKLAWHRAAHEADRTLAISYARIAFLEATAHDRPRSRTMSSVPRGDLTMQQIISENPVCTASNLVTTREAFDRIGAFDVGMDYAEDQEWLARAVALGERARGIDELLVGYRLSPGGLSVNLGAMYAGWRRVVELHASDADSASAEAIYCRYLARRSLRSGNPPAEARYYAMRGIALSPRAFLSDLKRGGSTLLAAITAPAIPMTLRQRIFA